MSQIERKNAEFEDFGRFRIESRNFSRQFCEIYKVRLASLKVSCLKKAKSKWSEHKILQIVDLTKEEYEEKPCIIIGTLYKHQELKPSILKEISEELQAVPQPPRLNYCSPKDTLFLEDDIGRVKLVGNLTSEALVTGLACAVFGHGLSNGSFWVEDFCFPGISLKPLTQTISSCAKDHGKFLLFFSGLDLVNVPDTLAMELMSDWINGLAGSKYTQEEAANIVRIVIAGNSIRGSTETFTRKGYFENKKILSIFNSEADDAMRRLDKYLCNICKSCNITILPGEFDPSCHSIPQHPFHPQIMPQTTKSGNLHNATNPWLGKIGSRVIAGSSGQPIKDIMKVTNIDVSPLYWMEKTLEWQHFAPTAPDTLAEYPFNDSDPFVMKGYPHIYFAGNMEKYESKLVFGSDGNDDYGGQPIRLICIPKFSSSHMAILVDLESLDTKPISFGFSES